MQQQRQLRLGDILDDYCTRERRLTNHVVVAMIGDDVKQTRCTTCDAEHEYKHARVPKRRKTEPAALYAPGAAPAPKRVVHEATTPAIEAEPEPPATKEEEPATAAAAPEVPVPGEFDEPLLDEDGGEEVEPGDEGPVHRTLIRAQLPRVDGQPPAPRQTPDFTIRQPGGRPNRFRPRGGGQGFQGNNRSNGNSTFGSARGAGPRQPGGRPPHLPQTSRQGPNGPQGRKRSK